MELVSVNTRHPLRGLYGYRSNTFVGNIGKPSSYIVDNYKMFLPGRSYRAARKSRRYRNGGSDPNVKTLNIDRIPEGTEALLTRRGSTDSGIRSRRDRPLNKGKTSCVSRTQLEHLGELSPVGKVRQMANLFGILEDGTRTEEGGASVTDSEVFEAYAQSRFEDGDNGCKSVPRLINLLRKCQYHLKIELGIVPVRLPSFSGFRCGSLRQCLQGCYDNLTPQQLLSIKTSAKLEYKYCGPCTDLHCGVVEQWENQRFREVEVDPDHLRLFADQFGRNVEVGWNCRPYPYIPNGHATLDFGRAKGGNWNKGVFSNWCRPALVMSSGKPRVVTLFSEYNTSVLTPLHNSLYDGLRKRKWVLVGDPEDAHVNALNGDGDIVSLDYKAATDSFKTAYVRAAIEVLISKGVGLSDDQVRCLRVLGELRLSEGGQIATVGQPMGSVMSFPLLCLFNKTVQDLALNDLLQEKKIGVREWRRHRTLVNGDDGMTRSPRKSIDLKARIGLHSARVGMEVNDEKTMVSFNQGEINSTLFSEDVRRNSKKRGVVPIVTKVQKSNLGAIAMRPEVNDVLAFAQSSSVTAAGFIATVRSNARVLAKQVDKGYHGVRESWRRLLLGDRRIRNALKSSPYSVRDAVSGRLGMVARPEGYDLSKQDEVTAINSAVARIRSRNSDLSVDRPVAFKTSSFLDPQWRNKVLRFRARPSRPDLTLKVLETAWKEKKYKEMRDESSQTCGDVWADEFCAASQCYDTTRVQFLLSKIKTRQAPPQLESASTILSSYGMDSLSMNKDFVSF